MRTIRRGRAGRARAGARSAAGCRGWSTCASSAEPRSRHQDRAERTGGRRTGRRTGLDCLHNCGCNCVGAFASEGVHRGISGTLLHTGEHHVPHETRYSLEYCYVYSRVPTCLTRSVRDFSRMSRWWTRGPGRWSPQEQGGGAGLAGAAFVGLQPSRRSTDEDNPYAPPV